MRLTKIQVIKELVDKKSLKHFPEWIDDKEVVLVAVKQNGCDLEHASERLKNDKEVILEAMKYNGGYSGKYSGWILGYASERLKNDKELMLGAVKKNGWSLIYASDRLKKELLPQALSSFGYTYTQGLSSIELVKYDGRFLSLLTTEEQNDKEIVLEAIIKNVVNIEYASQEIRDKIKNSDPVRFLEKWIKSEKLEQQLDKKEKSSKIKL